MSEPRPWSDLAGFNGSAERCTCSDAQLSLVGCECDAEQNLPLVCGGPCGSFLRTPAEVARRLCTSCQAYADAIEADLARRATKPDSIWDRPLAIHPYTSYRYRLAHGGIHIGARTDDEALSEAGRSLSSGEVPDPGLLERWDGEAWHPVGNPRRSA